MVVLNSLDNNLVLHSKMLVVLKSLKEFKYNFPPPPFPLSKSALLPLIRRKIL